MKKIDLAKKGADFYNGKRVNFRGINIDLPARYRGEALSVLHPVSTKEVKFLIGDSRIVPAEIIPGQSLLSITFFNFHSSPVGPYAELVYAVPIFFKPKSNFPPFKLLMNKFFSNFGFYVIDIAQTTEIAIAHGDIVTGYPHNQEVIKIGFNQINSKVAIDSYSESGKIISIKGRLYGKERYIEDTYQTYYLRNNKLSKIQMNIYGIEIKIKNCSISFGNHGLTMVVKKLNIINIPIQARYFSDVVEVNPINKVSLC